ncbi:uncharacterized protein LOC105357079 isoform X2 [Oryzias latipes]
MLMCPLLWFGCWWRKTLMLLQQRCLNHPPPRQHFLREIEVSHRDLKIYLHLVQDLQQGLLLGRYTPHRVIVQNTFVIPSKAPSEDATSQTTVRADGRDTEGQMGTC